MTTLNQAREAVYSRFIAQFTGTSNIVFDNEAPPFDTNVVTEWVRLAVRNIERAQDTIGVVGNRRYRSGALVFVQVYTRSDTGVQQSDTLTIEVVDIFEGVSFSGLDFNEAISKEIGPDGKWYQAVVEAQFDYDEIK
ncbi:MAG: hypothetical protein V3S55_15445 [Nitrospiraceae bacterium]